MNRGKQKIEAQRKNAERNQKPKSSQLETRAVALKVICKVQLANSNQLGDTLPPNIQKRSLLQNRHDLF